MCYEVNRTKKEIEDYLEKKYNDEFLVQSIENPDYMTDYFIAKAENRGDTVTVLLSKETNQYKDDFEHVIKRKQMENEFIRAIREVLNNRFIKYDRNSIKVFIASFLAPFSDKDFSADYYVYLPARIIDMEEGETALKDMADEIFDYAASCGILGLIRIYVVDDDIYENITENNITSILPDYYSADGKSCLFVSRKAVTSDEGIR